MVFYLIHLLNLVISTRIELDSLHGLQIFLSLRNVLVSVSSDIRQLHGGTHYHLFQDVTSFHNNLWIHFFRFDFILFGVIL